MDELKPCPCPFCGSDKAYVTGVNNWFVVCEKCGATGPIRYDGHYAIAAWNERQPDADLLAACKAALGGESSRWCKADHHGNCQTHNLDPIDRCWVKLTEAAIAKYEGTA